MFSTCIYCTKSLGANRVFETFPVGKRLAFDGATGRLWVVCTHCERWNLSPVEERWEAIEQAETLYRATPTRAATENVGLARLADGTTIVRIGTPLRSEFAAWRYGDQFGRRRRKQLAIAAGGLAVAGAAFAASVAGQAAIGFSVFMGTGLLRPVNLGFERAVASRVSVPDHGIMHVRNRHLRETTLGRASDGALRMRLSCDEGILNVEDREAERVLGLVIPKVNRNGAPKSLVQDAVAEIDRCGGPERFLAEFSGVAEMHTGRFGLIGLPAIYALAVEMALHEESEWRAMHGELADLEEAWLEAEAIGRIADELELPEDVERAFAKLKAEK